MNMDKDAMLWIGCFRYCLGRKTYVSSEFCEHAGQSWPDVPKQAQHVIERDLKEEIERDKRSPESGFLGHECDKSEWLGFYNFIEKQRVIH